MRAVGSNRNSYRSLSFIKIGLDIGVMKARIDEKWVAMTGGVTQIQKKEVIILVNEAENAS